MDINLKIYLKEKQILIDKALDFHLPPQDKYPPLIHKAMRYSIFAGGKRLRPVLCMAAAEAMGGEAEKLLPVACALEMIHTYSLIHDDLPAMDDDTYRRGKLTNHKVFGEGAAILAGDALLTIAFETLAEFGLTLKSVQRRKLISVVLDISKAAGSLGMIGGQIADLGSEGVVIDPDELKYIHMQKTGALFKAAIRAGAILSGASAKELKAITIYAENFGLAFQITDDILDIVGDSTKTGKSTGSDVRNKKATYPSLYGLEQSQQMAAKAVGSAIEALGEMPGDIEALKALAQYLLVRES